MTEHVVVATRARPLTPQEELRGASGPYTLRMDKRHTIFVDPATPQYPRAFDFDHNYWSLGDPQDPGFASQRRVFEELGRPLLTHALSGYNACIFAYGQTSSGKTYTMMGPPGDFTAMRNGAHTGLIPRMCDELFCRLADLHLQSKEVRIQVDMSFYEIYNEKIYDLLDPDTNDSLRIREDRKQVYVDGLSECPVEHFLQIQELLKIGNRRRHTSATRMNDRSSRSHAVFCLLIRKREWHATEGDTSVFTSRMNLVDLAGSERTHKAGTEGTTLREGININLGLSKLGLVIRKLADMNDRTRKGDSDYVPYRDSLLTRVLQENLGGSSRTVMLATISPCSFSADETLNTLRYAERVKFIRNTPLVNESSGNSQVLALRRKVRELESQLSSRAALPMQLRQRAASGDTAAGNLVGGVRAAQLRGAAPVLVLRTKERPHRADVITVTLQEGFTIVSDAFAYGDDLSPSSPDEAGPLADSRVLGASFDRTATGQLSQSFQNSSFAGSFDDAGRRARTGGRALQRTGSGVRSRRRRGSSSYMNPTLASGMKHSATAAALEDAGKAGELGRDVAHTVVSDDAAAQSRRSERRRRNESAESSRSPRPRPRNSRNTIARALQLARDKITRLQQEGREGSLPHIVDDEGPDGECVVEYPADPEEADSPVRDRADTDSPQKSGRGKAGGSASRGPSPNVARTQPLVSSLPLDSVALPPAADDGEPNSARSEPGLLGSLYREIERLWDSSGTPSLRPSEDRLRTMSDDAGGGVQHLRLRAGVPGVGCPHSLIRRVGANIWLMPLSGTTLIDGREVAERGAHSLRHGSTVQFGEHEPYSLVVPRDDDEVDEMLGSSLSSTCRRRCSSKKPSEDAGEEVQRLRLALAEQELKLVAASQEIIAERQLRCSVDALRRERDVISDDRQNLRHALRQSQEDVERLQKQLATAEVVSLSRLCEREDSVGSTGVQHQVFQKTPERPHWRAVGPPMGGDEDIGHLVLVDDRENATGQVLQQCESLRQNLRKTEGELLMAQQEREEAVAAAAGAADALGSMRREASAIRDDARTQVLEIRQTMEALQQQAADGQSAAEELSARADRIAELEEEVDTLSSRIRDMRDTERTRMRQKVSSVEVREGELDSRLRTVVHQEEVKLRQISILQDQIEQMRLSIEELANEKKSKLAELSAEIEQKLNEKAAAAVEVSALQLRVRSLREEEEKRRGLMERLRKFRDDMMDSKELRCIDEAEFTGFRLDDPTFRRKGIQMSRQGRTPVRLVFGASSLKVFASDGVRAGYSATQYRRPASPMPGGSTSAPGCLKEVRYDAMRQVKQVDGSVLAVESQGFLTDLYLFCDDRLRRNTVHKLLLLKTKGVMVPLRHYDVDPDTTVDTSGVANGSAVVQPTAYERQRTRSPVPQDPVLSQRARSPMSLRVATIRR